MDSKLKNPKVLISYSHDSGQHKEKVLALCDRLRADGVDSVIDHFISSPKEGWPRWMINQIDVADFVLVVATAEYSRRFSNGSNALGRGVKWEGLVITQELYASGSNNTKFVPVVLCSGDIENIPIILQGATSYDVSNRQSYNDLYRHITRQARTYIREPGPVQEFPPLIPRPHKFDVDEPLSQGAESCTYGSVEV